MFLSADVFLTDEGFSCSLEVFHGDLGKVGIKSCNYLSKNEIFSAVKFYGHQNSGSGNGFESDISVTYHLGIITLSSSRIKCQMK
jgi:hypothetical protein